ncbi:hypothetical protein N665_0012s0145 [Sinapis alba]|nr:hypothetical protein N665_0012s0145 [Sinapis alba]
MAGLPDYFHVIVEECIENNMNKDEAVRHLWDKYLIPYELANIVWNHLERENPDLFISYYTRICERNAQPLWDSPNVQRYAAESPQEAIAVYPSTQAGPANANAIENQNLQTSQQKQQPDIPSDFWEQLLNTLGQIQSNTEHLNTLRQIQSNTEHLNTLSQIQSNTDQMVKLLTDGHGFGPHHSAAGSSKRQRVEDAEERCNSEEAAKLQEKEEGDDEESEKLQEKEKDHN